MEKAISVARVLQWAVPRNHPPTGSDSDDWAGPAGDPRRFRLVFHSVADYPRPVKPAV